MDVYKGKITFLLFFLFFFNVLTSASFGESGSLHNLYGELLGKYVQDGVVDYQGLKKEEGKLDQYLAELDKTMPEKLGHDEQLALYINAYNAYTIKLILDNFNNGSPLKSIKNIGGFFSKPWSIKFCKIGGKVYSLDNIEHDIIRPVFKDPRVHFAVNCASQSCPPLLSKPYIGAILEEQLSTSTRAFLNNPKNTYIKGNKLYVSRIFKWFSEDFNNNPRAFVEKYADPGLHEKLRLNSGKIKVTYLDYDWSLNDRRGHL